MEYRVAINGFGRIGRNYVRWLLERGLQERGINVAGINDLGDPGTLAHLLQNDTTLARSAGMSTTTTPTCTSAVSLP
jgi:glyceraldehyde 3-phosphate dehydrogenase